MSYKNLIVPLDGTPFAETTLPHAIDLCQKFQAVCHLIQVVPTYSYAPLGVMYPGAIPLGVFPAEPPNEMRERDLQQARDYLSKVQERLGSLLVDSTKTVVTGYAEDAILELEREVQADLILIASHQRSGLSRLLAPNTSTVIALQADCPVMAVRGTEEQSIFGELSLNRRIQQTLNPIRTELAALLDLSEDTLLCVLPRAVGMLLSAVAEERRRGPEMKELFSLTKRYYAVRSDLAAYLEQLPDEPPLKMVSYMFHERGAWAASALAQDVEGIETDQCLKLLAALTPIVLAQLEDLAQEGSELRLMIGAELSKAALPVQEAAERTARIVSRV